MVLESLFIDLLVDLRLLLLLVSALLALVKTDLCCVKVSLRAKLTPVQNCQPCKADSRAKVTAVKNKQLVQR